MRCPNCGNQVPKESMFCNKCGTRLGTEPFMRPVSPYEDTSYHDSEDEYGFMEDDLDIAKDESLEEKDAFPIPKPLIITIGVLLVCIVIAGGFLLFQIFSEKNHSGGSGDKNRQPVQTQSELNNDNQTDSQSQTPAETRKETQAAPTGSLSEEEKAKAKSLLEGALSGYDIYPGSYTAADENTFNVSGIAVDPQGGTDLSCVQTFDAVIYLDGPGDVSLGNVEKQALNAQTFKNVSTSSVCPEEAGFTYEGVNVVDGSDTTAWIEGVAGYGAGEWIQLESGSEKTVYGICIKNGYIKNNMTLVRNGQIRRIRVEGQDGSSQEFDLNMSSDISGSYSDILVLDQPMKTASIKITILDTYAGQDYTNPEDGKTYGPYEDTCITEINVMER